MVYIHVVFFMFILCRNLSKIRNDLDFISFDNIDLTLYLKYVLKYFYFNYMLIFCSSSNYFKLKNYLILTI
jgi:hypothetical protein